MQVNHDAEPVKVKARRDVNQRVRMFYVIVKRRCLQTVQQRVLRLLHHSRPAVRLGRAQRPRADHAIARKPLALLILDGRRLRHRIKAARHRPHLQQLLRHQKLLPAAHQGPDVSTLYRHGTRS